MVRRMFCSETVGKINPKELVLYGRRLTSGNSSGVDLTVTFFSFLVHVFTRVRTSGLFLFMSFVTWYLVPAT